MAKQKEAFIEAQKPVVVQKMVQEKRPDWTSEKPYFEDDAGFHFTGGIMGEVDYALTLRLAKSEVSSVPWDFVAGGATTISHEEDLFNQSLNPF